MLSWDEHKKEFYNLGARFYGRSASPSILIQIQLYVKFIIYM